MIVNDLQFTEMLGTTRASQYNWNVGVKDDLNWFDTCPRTIAIEDDISKIQCKVLYELRPNFCKASDVINVASDPLSKTARVLMGLFIESKTSTIAVPSSRLMV